MLLTYERISSQIEKDIIIFPVDYPFLYAQKFRNKCPFRNKDTGEKRTKA